MMLLFNYIIIFLIIFIIYQIIKLLLAPIRANINNPPAFSYKHKYLDPNNNNKYDEYPSLYDQSSVYLSFIVPAYNEENRLHQMMQETLEYIEKRKRKDKTFTYEIIVVNDGSKDRTSSIAMEYVKRYDINHIRLLDLKVNQGKGGAVQQGMLHSRGEYLLMVDADGATDIRDLDKMEKELKKVESNGYGVAVGSRAHLAEKAVAKRKWYRNILMYGFHFLVYILAVRTIKDTQCGFKLFTRKSAQILFANLHFRRWSFDVELLKNSETLKWPIVEVGVRWEEIPGSKLNLLESSILMGRDLVVICFCYLFGIWKLNANIDDIKKAASQGIAL